MNFEQKRKLCEQQKKAPMTPAEATEYWGQLNTTPLPPPVRPFTEDDQLAIFRKCQTRGITGRQYLDFIQSLRIETGHPSDSELFDFSHLISAVSIERRDYESSQSPSE